ncbi:hypothetical protein A1O3_10218 [Capronia epimyces CBS 606.96]|uniref:Defect at low temperature protein 1 n=1 Tax=Capronia epimyces CBS 606.96 TaxID=1182542 RepID=W9XI84_9EURO|nr:uncharacterized protein A1O3_10218 [Capronia epimyces CBS 606.96]EXJ77060.1 hypothetical protein A1O3_10218 [Capronia epimyces CBS 606.96]
MPQARQVLFRIFYSTSFTVVFLILVGFICFTPADAIYESYKRHRLLDIFLITGAYVLTALIAALMYASRLYTNRSVLRDIPKTFLPIEKEDLPGKRVHRLIQDCLERSAVIAYQARPRSRRIEHETETAGARMLALTNSPAYTDQNMEPPWGEIAHPGWSSPAFKEMPNLEYATVVDELTDLVEAKAVSLAPLDPRAEPGPDGTPMPDPRVIDELARPEAIGMRPYLRHLIDLGVVPDTPLTAAFLAAYERARFSSKPLTDGDFQALMRMFAELLRNMAPVNAELLDLDASSYEPTLSEASSVSSHGLHQRPPDPETSSAASTFSNSGSVRHHQPPPRRISEDSAAPSLSSLEQEHDHAHNQEEDTDARSLRTAPTTISRSRSRLTLGSNSLMVSAASRPNLHSASSHESLHSRLSSRSRRTRRSGPSNRNVIRLTRDSEGGDLPYTIQSLPSQDGSRRRPAQSDDDDNWI